VEVRPGGSAPRSWPGPGLVGLPPGLGGAVAVTAAWGEAGAGRTRAKRAPWAVAQAVPQRLARASWLVAPTRPSGPRGEHEVTEHVCLQAGEAMVGGEAAMEWLRSQRH
jgi:hypothetical protein